jgi:hypothetical protein
MVFNYKFMSEATIAQVSDKFTNLLQQENITTVKSFKLQVPRVYVIFKELDKWGRITWRCWNSTFEWNRVQPIDMTTSRLTSGAEEN